MALWHSLTPNYRTDWNNPVNWLITQNYTPLFSLVVDRMSHTRPQPSAFGEAVVTCCAFCNQNCRWGDIKPQQTQLTTAHEEDNMAWQLRTWMVGKLCGRGTHWGTFHPSYHQLHFRGPNFSQAWTAVFYVLENEWVLNWALDGDEWSASHPKCFTPSERLPGWVGFTASVVFWRTQKTSLVWQEWKLKTYSLWLCFLEYIFVANCSTIRQFKKWNGSFLL